MTARKLAKHGKERERRFTLPRHERRLFGRKRVTQEQRDAIDAQVRANRVLMERFW